MPPAERDAFLLDLRSTEEARAKAVVESTRRRSASAWDRWHAYCSSLNIRSDLSGVTGADALLRVFALRVRRGDFNRNHQQVRAGTVSTYLSAISKKIIQLVDAADRNPAVAPGSYHPSLKDMLKAFARDDPPPKRVWPVNTDILSELLQLPAPVGTSPAKWRRLQDMSIIGFFFLLRPGEYAHGSDDTQSKPFRLRNVLFLEGPQATRLDQAGTTAGPTKTSAPALSDCNDSNVQYVGLQFDDQKSGFRSDQATHSRSHTALCPVDALQRICRDILQHHGSDATPLYNYYEPSLSRFRPLDSASITAALKLAAGKCYSRTGIHPDNITARSLRAGGATALLCAGIAKDIVKLVGRWRSDAVDRYLRTGTITITEGYAARMVHAGSYRFIPVQTTPLEPDTDDDLLDGTDDFDTYPDALPHTVSDEIRQQYLEHLLSHPEEVDLDDPA